MRSERCRFKFTDLSPVFLTFVHIVLLLLYMCGSRIKKQLGSSRYSVIVCILFIITLTLLFLKFKFEVELHNLTVRIADCETNQSKSTSCDKSSGVSTVVFRDLHRPPPELNNQTENSANPEISIFLFRIQFTIDGRCIGISKTKHPIVKFCDPQQNDIFVFLGGKIKSEDLNLCIGIDQVVSSLLVFIDCKDAVIFEFDGARLLHKKESGVKKCISAMHYNTEESDWNVSAHNNLGARIGLNEPGCLGKSARFELIDNDAFLKDRAALLLSLPETSNRSCNYSACGINRSVPPVKALPISQIKRCSNLSQCVTVVTKTARRPLFVIRLAKSLRERLKMDLPMVVIDDDGPKPYKPEIMDEIAKFPNMKYVTSTPDLGIAAGRTMGLEMVKTKYFMILDDDMVATEDTDIARLVKILDSSDATLVGGGSNFAGFLEFGYSDRKTPTLYHYQKSCTLANQSLSWFPNCFRCEITSNIFVARTQDALSVGGWSKELKIVEHKDFFLRLKAAGKKVVYCPDFRAKNVHSNVGVEFVGGMKRVFNTYRYYQIRVLRVRAMLTKFCNRWNILNVKLVKNKIPQWIIDDNDIV